MRSLNLPRLSLVAFLLLYVFTAYAQDESRSNKLFPERSIYLQFSPTYGKFFSSLRGAKNYFQKKPWVFKLGWEMEAGFDLPLKNDVWIASLSGGYQSHRTRLFYSDAVIVNNGFFAKTGISRRIGQRFYLGVFPWVKWLNRQEAVGGSFNFTDYANPWYGFTLLNRYTINQNTDLVFGFTHTTAISEDPIFNLIGTVRAFDREFPFWYNLGVRWYPQI